jgi:cytochrome d ubiquinol oxidase subunit I
MQTPQGYTISPQGQFLPASWFDIIFNPSFPYRLVHMVLASYLAVAFIVGAVGAFHLLRDNTNRAARTMFSMAMWMAVIVAPIQIVAGDLHGLNTLKYQPAKIAAMEGHFDASRRAPLILFGMPNMAAGRTDYAIEIPLLGSLILTHSLDGEIPGLNSFPPGDRPYAPVVFWAFRVMVGLGLLMFGAGLFGLFERVRRRLYTTVWLQRIMVAMGPAGFIAILSGWTVTEVGRQPFTVYGMLRTAQSVSPIGLPGISTSLAAFVIVYFIVYGAGLVFLLRLMARPPVMGEAPPRVGDLTRAAGTTPIAALQAGE